MEHDHMARPVTAKFSERVIHLGDGADPEVFAPICGLTTKGLTVTNNTQSTPVPDCIDEDLPAFEEKSTDTQSASIAGTGVWTKERHNEMLDWALKGDERNIRYQFVNVTSGDVEFLDGPAILTSMGDTVERGKKVMAELAIEFSQAPTPVVAA